MNIEPRIVTPIDHLDTWLFDLDNTLYPATSNLFPQIDARMKAFIARFLHVPEDEAFRIQKAYYREFGTTLRGLMLRHGLEPDTFLDFVHDIDHSVLDHDPRMDAALAALPGRKLVFTNGSEAHAVKTLERLGLSHHFESIFDIKAADYIPKPQPATYGKLTSRLGVDPRRAAFFEDSHLNLKPAAEIGMTTVLVRSGPDHAPLAMTPDTDLAHCHHITDDLPAWLTAAAGLLKG